jgi:N6-adenosine-specific RNA methylase IME4
MTPPLASIFPPLPTTPGGFQCVSMDAALHFETWSAKGQGRSPSRHYRTHAPEALKALPLEAVLAKDAWGFFWWPDPHLPQLIEIMAALGFEFSGKAFTWIKLKPSLVRGPRLMSSADIEAMLHLGAGLTTRKNSESCWLGRRGKPKILSRAAREIIVAPVRDHSRKPDEFYHRVEAFCPGPRLDCFSRQTRPDWVAYGEEAGKFDRPAGAAPVSRRHDAATLRHGEAAP